MIARPLNPPHRFRRPGRAPGSRGFTLVEIIATGVLLGAVLMSLAPVMRWVADSHRESQHRQLAQYELNNLLERLTAGDRDDLQQRAAAATLSDSAQARLDRPRLRIAVSEPAGSPPAQRITVELDWQDRQGVRVRPVRLTTWISHRAEAP